MQEIRRVKIKGEKSGYCNICGSHSTLTRDHIPPQGCVKPKPVELRTLTQYLSNPNEKPTYSQSGLNILSICANCNNKLLGTEYDQELIQLTRKVSSFVKANHDLGIVLPEEIPVSIKPQRLIRAVIGHILAGKLPNPVQPPMPATFSDILRSYFLDPHSSFPDNLEVYYWLYPSNKQIVINPLSIGSFAGEGTIVGSCLLKFFPLAFWIVWEKPHSFPINLAKISKDSFKGLDDTYEIVIDLQNIPSLNYPEIPEKTRFLLISDKSTFIASPKKPKKEKSKGFG